MSQAANPVPRRQYHSSAVPTSPDPVPLVPPRGHHALRQRVADAIVAAAADVFARAGTNASMADVAAAAGVARATVYRYFPTRQALLDELASVAINDAGARLADARLESVGPEEGVTRAVRALLEVGDYFTVLARERVRPEFEAYERLVMMPLRQLCERGREMGVLRADVPTEWLTNAFVGLVLSVVQSSPSLGRDDTVAAVSGLFLDGARVRP